MCNSTTQNGLIQVKMAIAAAEATNKLLAIYGRVANKFPLSTSHCLFYGSAGCGKTTLATEAAKMMGCSEEQNTFTKLSGEVTKTIEDLLSVLVSKLSWKGYICNHGVTDHSNCPKENHVILDPINPRAPIQPQVIFFDEIHVLPKDLQEKLGLIILDFRYEILTKKGLKTIYFPKFTFIGATTKPGMLLKPLRTRFGLKVSVSAFSDFEMLKIVNNMVADRKWKVESEAIEIIAKMSQGIPREASNHLTGLFGCWRYLLNTGQDSNNCVITKNVAVKYAEIQEFTLDGFSKDQIRILKYLSEFADSAFNKVKGVGVNRILGALNLDADRFNDELEPHLVARGYMIAGGKGREITKAGFQYISSINI